MLKKGLNFSIAPTKIPKLEIVASVESVLHKLLPTQQDELRWDIRTAIASAKPHTQNLTKDEAAGIKSLKNDKNLTILPADKGNATVVMNTSDYENKIRQLIESDQYIVLKKDPTTSIERQVYQLLRKHQPHLTEPTKRKLTPHNSKPPHIYGLPKIHKLGFPLRPIISSCDSPCQALSKFLLDIVAPLSGNTPSHVKNSSHFKTIAEQLSIEQNDMLVSFDVQSLFTNVPVPETLAIIERRLENDESLTKRTNIPIPTIMELLSICVNTTYFQFKEKFYKQTDGMAMGSSLSPFMANIFMENLEQEAISQTDTPPKVWLRYVDDTFLIWQHGHDKLQIFADLLNSLRPSIKFTHEIESDHKLPFLDVLVCRNNNVIKTAVYRKPTNTGQYLHFKSNHASNTKSGIIQTLVNRAEKICSEQDNKCAELNHIKEDLLANGYPNTFINKHMVRKSTISAPVDRETPVATMVLPYVKGLSEKIRRLASKHNIRTAFKSGSTLRNILTKVKPDCDQADTKECIYKVPCECGNVYIGETGRPLSIRIKEHKRNCKQGETDKSRLAEHAWSHSHKILFDKAEPIAKEPNVLKRKIKESAFITGNKNVFSQQSIQLKDIWFPIVKREVHLLNKNN